MISGIRERVSEQYARLRLSVSSIWRWQQQGEVAEILVPAAGMFACYVSHDALQEEMFRLDGFEFGWFMTLTEVSVMIVGALVSEGLAARAPPGGRYTWIMTGIIGLCVSISHGSGNTALKYSSYPLKVAFKSCKLVPTMLLGVCVTGRRHSLAEYVAAAIMCSGLVLLSVADEDFSAHHIKESAKAHLGPILLTISTSMDAVVPNLQERLFRLHDLGTVEMVFLSNIFMIFVLSIVTTSSGELFDAIRYCRSHPRAIGILILQSISAYVGLRCYLTVIKSHGGVAGVLLSNARKIVTIVLSFLIFAKPCRMGHILGLFFIFMGVYLGATAKKRTKKKTEEHTNGQHKAEDEHEHEV